MSTKKIYAVLVKPFFDKMAALLLLILCTPLLLICVLVLAVQHRGRFLFYHQRIGKNEKSFNLYKLRTMDDFPENSGISEEKRITRIGAFLRILSVDELPQLYNVLKGEMSLVGPRPLLPEYLPYYTSEEKRRHLVKPGITGWAQVHGRNSANWESRMKNDLDYTDSFSFWLDCRILLLTVLQFFKFKQADFNMQNQCTFIEYAKKR
ncbi:MAG: sugar transferase [Cyclobacteriaceae bacterium]